MDAAVEGCTFLSDLAASGDASFKPSVEMDVKNDVFALPYSSGTTGNPKGVQVTHYNFLTCLAQIA